MKQRWFMLILLICCLLSGCSEKETQRGNEYFIYGLKNGTTRLETITYRTDTIDTQKLIEEILDQFLNLDEKDVTLYADANPHCGISFLHCWLQGSSIRLYGSFFRGRRNAVLDRCG